MSQKQQIHTYKSKFIRAGAGAGKTTQLIRTFFDFTSEFRKNNQNLFPKIVITTFTKKATQEVKERLLVEAVKTGDQDLVAFVNKKSKVHISTIHGVLSSYLNQNIEALDFVSQIRIVDSKTISRSYAKVLKKIFEQHPSYLSLLENYSFKDLIYYLNVAMEFYWQFPDQIQTLNKADLSKAVLSRIKDLIPALEHAIDELKDKNKPAMEAYADYLERFIREIRKQSEGSGLSLDLLDLYDSRPSKPRIESEVLDEHFKSTSKLLTYADTEDYLRDFSEVNEQFFSLLKEFAVKVFEQKKQTGIISISDLEILSLKLMEERPETLDRFSQSFDLFMIDEYQDTSPLQVRLVDRLTHRKPQFIVGDPQQSIYLFRGARSEVFSNKEKAVENSFFDLIKLETNYRSRPDVMKLINDLFTNVSGRFSGKFSSMIPKTTTESLDEKHIAGYYIKTDDEYSAIINQISHLVSIGANFSDICVLFSKNKDVLDFANAGLQYNIPIQPQIAAGFDQKREIMDLVFFLRFLVNPHDTQNLISLLRSPWCVSSDDDLLQCRQQTTASEISFWSQMKSSINLNITTDFKNLKEDYLSYCQNGVMPALEKFINRSGFFQSLFYLDNSGQRESNLWKFILQIKEAITQDSFSLNQFISDQFVSLTADLTSTLSEGIPILSDNRVSVMTIHSSKGLEFKHVIIGGMSAGPNPRRDSNLILDEDSKAMSLSIYNEYDAKNQNSDWAAHVIEKFKEREKAEYERLFYVACTRAEDSLTLVWDESKKTAKESWINKLVWPEEGVHEKSGYRIASGTDNETPEVFLAVKGSKSMVKSLFQDKTSSSSIEFSVTDLIEAQTPFKPKSSTDDFKYLYLAQKGTELHRIFESLKYLDAQEVLQNLKPEDQAAIQFMFDQNQIDFKQVLQNGHVEWGFGLKTADGFIQGQIDLWARLEDKVLIVDYKTGSSAYKDKAFKQLEVYASCLRKMGHIQPQDQVELVAIYPYQREIFKLSG